MEFWTIRTLVLFLLSLIMFIFSLWDVSDKLSEAFPFAAPLVPIIKYIFTISFLALSVGILIWLILSGKNYYDSISTGEKSIRAKRFGDFRCEDVRADDLKDVVELLHKSTDVITTMEVTKALYAKCKKGWKKIVEDKSDEFLGYFIVLPLSKNGEKAIHSREFNIRSKKALAYINQRHTRNAPAYIGMMGVNDKRPDARAFAIEMLGNFVNDCGHCKVYARAVTSDGLRVLRRRRFKTVFENEKPVLNAFFVREMS